LIYTASFNIIFKVHIGYCVWNSATHIHRHKQISVSVANYPRTHSTALCFPK